MKIRAMMESRMAATVQRQRLWDQIGDLSNEGLLAHPNATEGEDE